MKTSSADKTLWNLPWQARAVVKKVALPLNESYRQRLLDFGIEEGVEILCLRHTVFGGPRVYQVRGFCVSFEKKIAENILIEELPI